MAFPSNPVEGQSYTENNTVWIYSAVTGQWNRSVISQVNETTYIGADGAPSGIGGDTQVIFNSNGSFAGDSGLTYNKTTDALTSGSLKVTSLGTAAAPAISVTGDPNTGIYSPGADQLAVATNGTGRLFVASDGKVGVGTSSPSARLSVVGDPGTNLVTTITSQVNSGSYIGYFDTTTTDRPLVGALGDNFVVRAGSVERVRVDSSGRVGIGTTSPTSTLHIKGGTANPPAIVHLQPDNNTVSNYITFRSATDTTRGYIEYNYVNDYLAFATTNGTERARIDSSGRLLVGTSTGYSFTHNTTGAAIPYVQLASPGNGAEGTASLALTQHHQGGASRCPGLFFARNRSGSPSSFTSVSDGDALGEVTFNGSDGTGFIRAAQIRADVDGTPGTNDMPGRLVFSTTADGAATPTERMRITSTGQVRLAGAGITFNGDTAAANELDDYEEGTFTPAIEGGTTAGTGTYSFRTGTYTKIGNVVVARLAMVWSSHTGTGQMRFTGLPFAATIPGTGSAYTNDVALTANTVPVPYWEAWNYFVIRQNTVGGGAGGGAAQMDAAGDINATLVYIA